MTRTASLLLLTFVLSLMTGCSSDTPKPAQAPAAAAPAASQPAAPVEKAVPVFDGGRAFGYLTSQCEFGPRVPGSDAHAKCLRYLEAELSKYADAVNLQSFTVDGFEGKPVMMTNIIASFRSQAPTRILLVAHWDCRPWADQETDPVKAKKPVLGANDAASGVAVLLEIARHLKETPPEIGVDILLTDGEDYGHEGKGSEYLRGAKYFAANLPPGFRPQFGILLDMVGDTQLELQKERYSLTYAPDVVEQVWSAARILNIPQFTESVQGYVTDDHLPLNKAGIKTIDLIDFDYPDESNRYWHTLEDTPDKCSPESLEAVGRVLLYVLYHQAV
jgi:hypothetical protein